MEYKMARLRTRASANSQKAPAAKETPGFTPSASSPRFLQPHCRIQRGLTLKAFGTELSTPHTYPTSLSKASFIPA